MGPPSDSPSEDEEKQQRNNNDSDFPDDEEEDFDDEQEEKTPVEDDPPNEDDDEDDTPEQQHQDHGGSRTSKKGKGSSSRKQVSKTKHKTGHVNNNNNNPQDQTAAATAGYGYGGVYGHGPMMMMPPPSGSSSNMAPTMMQHPQQQQQYGGMSNSRSQGQNQQQQQPPMMNGFPMMHPGTAMGGGGFPFMNPMGMGPMMGSTSAPQLSSSAFAMLATVNAATESFLKAKSNSTTKDTSSKSRRKNKETNERQKELVIKIRKDNSGDIVGSSITIESVQASDYNGYGSDDYYNDDDSMGKTPAKKKKRKKEVDHQYGGTRRPIEMIEKEHELERMLGPNPSLEDLSNYTRELFHGTSGDRNEDVDDPDGEKLAANQEKAVRTAAFFPKKDSSYTSSAWDEKLKQYLKYVAMEKTWVLKKKSVPYALRKWLVEQKYQYRNTFLGAKRSSDFTLNQPGESLDNEEADLSRRHLLTQEKYERLYRAGFPFPQLEAAEGKTLESLLVLEPPFPPIENKTTAEMGVSM